MSVTGGREVISTSELATIYRPAPVRQNYRPQLPDHHQSARYLPGLDAKDPVEQPDMRGRMINHDHTPSYAAHRDSQRPEQ
ncbi:hypothetical protein GFS60_06219 (plasmid) [Rhodococcus sp. WAY2]|nr:hypothetical protein GFS60_06219 [Rhodococcus sp. WAY2]